MGDRFRTAIGRFAVRKAVGVYVGDREVAVCHVALGPAGPVELSSRTEAYEPEKLVEVIGALVGPLAPPSRTGRTAVSIGLPALRVFFASRTVPVASRDATPTALLHEVLKSSDVNVDDMEVDLIRAQPGKKPLALMVASRRKYLTGVLAGFERCGIRPHRTEPAPFALLRLAAARHKAPRRARTVVRVFLGEAGGVAVLAANDLPLAWRAFELPAGSETSAICSAARAIQIVARFRGEIGGCDAAFVHGRPDLAGALTGAEFRQALGVDVRHAPDPAYDAPSIALGLALGAEQGDEWFDLSRALKPTPSFWEVLPAGDVALQAALLLCVTLFLNAKSEAARSAFNLVRGQAARHAWLAKLDDAKLGKEKKELEAKVDAVRDYLETRIVWSAYTRDAAVRLPESIALQSFEGVCELNTGKGASRAAAKKALTLKLAAPVVSGQKIPPEVDAYLGRLRRDAQLRIDFPAVELADLKWNQPSGQGKAALTEFTINCMPPAKSGGAPKGAPGKAGNRGG